MEGISNKKIVKFLQKKLVMTQKNFIGVFPSNFVTRFVTFHSMLRESGAQYPFIIMSTDRSDKKNMHWWSFLDLHPKKEIFLFDSFGFEDFKKFILQDNQRILNKILYGIEKVNKKDNKITLITLRLSRKEYEKIKKT